MTHVMLQNYGGEKVSNDIILSLGRKEIKKGKVRETILAKKYRRKGFQVLNAKNYNTGVDILAIDPKTGQIKEAIESTNYAKSSYMSKERAERYAKSLNQFPYAKKKVIVSYEENVGKEARKILEDNGVEIEVRGYQDLPIDDDHFKPSKTEKGKTLDNHDNDQT